MDCGSAGRRGGGGSVGAVGGRLAMGGAGSWGVETGEFRVGGGVTDSGGARSTVARRRGAAGRWRWWRAGEL